MKNSLVFIILLLYVNIIDISISKSALCFLTTRPKVEMIDFANLLSIDGLKYDMKVYIMINDQSYKIESKRSSYVKMIQIPNSKCILHGYEKSMYVRTRPIEIGIWDRAFLYFCKLNKNYTFVWFIEDDVFIPSIDGFRSIHKLYSDNNDLIVKYPIPNWTGDTSKWAHWSLANDSLVLPWYHSMTNAIGMSRRLLNTIDDHVRWRGISLIHEILPQTLAINSNMKVVSPIELNTLFWEEEITWEDIENNPNFLWHPVKNWTLQIEWHQRINNEKINIINKTEWFNLLTLCNHNQNSTLLQNYLNKLIFDFHQNKIYFSSDERHSIRQHFLYLAKQCENIKDFESAKVIIRELADSAYKISENQSPNITKSSIYLILEKKLEENKKDIFHLYNNHTIVNQLRQQAINLTHQLSFEITQEVNQQYQRIRQKEANLIKIQDDLYHKSIYKFNNISHYANLFRSLFIKYNFKNSLNKNFQIEYFLLIIFILCIFILLRLYSWKYYLLFNSFSFF